MAKVGQYWNGTDWEQFGLTTADITLGLGWQSIVEQATYFISIKDSDDNLYMLCGKSGLSSSRAKFIKITKTGIKTIATLNYDYSASLDYHTYYTNNMVLSRDNQSIVCTLRKPGGSNDISSIYELPTVFDDGTAIAPINFFPTLAYSSVAKFAIYKDLYIWVASGNTVKIYDYTTKAELASVSPGESGYLICCDNNNTAYALYHSIDTLTLRKITFNGYTLSNTLIFNGNIGYAYYTPKQLLIDPFGDLIILTNSGTASTLLKYTTAGVQIGTAITLANPSYNLNVDIDGNYFYYTALAEYMVPANATAGQPIKPLNEHIPTRGTGIVGYGSNTTGYQPSVYAE